jgi:rsbT co-antagonist protein RsbR
MLSRLVRRDANAEQNLRQQATQFLPLLIRALEKSVDTDIEGSAWDEVRSLLTEISHARVRQGFSPIETANFVFSLKEPLYRHLRAELANDPMTLVDETSITSALFDRLGLFTIEVYQKAREQVILRQQQELLELSTPVVQLWKDVLALPLIGTLDSARTQVVAQHLLKTIAAARLMGADCIISGIRPQIAQTIVHLGVNLEDVITKATLADAFVLALKRTGSTITFATATAAR